MRNESWRTGARVACAVFAASAMAAAQSGTEPTPSGGAPGSAPSAGVSASTQAPPQDAGIRVAPTATTSSSSTPPGSTPPGSAPPPQTPVVIVTAPSAAGASSGAREAPPRNVDGIRLRGGLSLNGGLFVGVPRSLPAEFVLGPGASLALRFGIQLNHVLAVYYQGTAFIGAMLRSGTEGFGMAGIYNSVLGSLTIADVIEIAAGPSFDYGANLQCDATMRVPCQTWLGGSIGGHGRLAILVGGRWPNVARRSGLAIGLDIHPMWQVDDATFLISATAGVGVDWY